MGRRKMQDRPLLTKAEGRDYLAATRWKLEHLINTGAIPVVRLGQRSVRIERSALDKLIAERRVIRGGRA